jgi:hypothetical protein
MGLLNIPIECVMGVARVLSFARGSKDHVNMTRLDMT